MSKYISISIILLFSVVLAVNGQSDARKIVVATSGDQYTAGNVQLNWTIGEVAIQAVKSPRNQITQGYHQGDYAINNVFERNIHRFDVSIYPNPSADFVQIDLKDLDRKVVLELYDLTGQLLISAALSEADQQYELDLRSLTASSYVLKLSSLDAEYLSSYKIIKLK